MQLHPTHPYNYYTLNPPIPPSNNYHTHTHVRAVYLFILFKCDIAAGIKDLAKALFLTTRCFYLWPEGRVWRYVSVYTRVRAIKS